jgi:colicin import membrane protein
MSGWAIARRAGAVVLVCVAIAPSARANDAASALAEKFAVDPDRAEARRPQAKQQAQDLSRQRAAPQAAENARRASEQRAADEADMLARARREAQESKAAEEQARLVEEARRLVLEAQKARAGAAALIEEDRRQAAETGARMVPSASTGVPREIEDAARRRAAATAAEQERARAAEEERLAQLRREESRRLIEKLNRVRQIREARIAAQERRALAAQKEEQGDAADRRDAHVSPYPPSEPRMALGGRDREGEGGFPDTDREDWKADRVTVLLVLAPGTYGIRRHGPKVADPILCTAVGCYVSQGADSPARFMPGRKALGFGNTWGQRAGACRQRLGCVFRAVEIGRWPAHLQPVDLHILKHDRRRPHEVAGDSACRASGGRLLCGRGIYAESYAMWIVPERLAEAAGPDVLERAVREGLDGPRSADTFTLLGR